MDTGDPKERSLKNVSLMTGVLPVEETESTNNSIQIPPTVDSSSLLNPQDILVAEVLPAEETESTNNSIQIPPPVDSSSLSNPQDILVTHLKWTVRVDFETCILSAEATYDLKRFDLSQTILYLDTSHLIIDAVHCCDNGGGGSTAVPYDLEPPSLHLG